MTEENIIKQSEHIEYDELAEILNSQEDFSGKIVVINESAAKIGYDTNSVYIRLGIGANDIEDIAEKYSHAEELIEKLNVKLDGAFGKVTNGLETSHNGLQAGDTLNVDSHMGHTAKFVGYDAAEDIYVVRFDKKTYSCAEDLYGEGAWYIDMDKVGAEEKVTIDDVEYSVRSNHDGFYLKCDHPYGENNKWFTDHRIGASDFIERVVGYKPSNGIFPEVKTRHDLMEVVDAMKSYKPNKFKVGDKVRFVDCDDSINGHVDKHWARDKLIHGHTYTVKWTRNNVIVVSGWDYTFDENQFILADEPIPFDTIINIDGITYSAHETYLHRTRGLNSEIFRVLGIDKYEFLDNLGISYKAGSFPVVDRKDLPKVVDALIAYEKPVVKKGSIVKFRDEYYIVKEADTDNTCRLDIIGWVSNDDIEILRE